MSYNFTSMYPATPKFSREVCNLDERRKQQIENLLNYAEKRYHCTFSEKFKEKMLKGVYGYLKIPKQKVIDALVREWRVWEQYVSKDSFSGFIEDGLKSIMKINATATFHSSSLNGFIGNKAMVIKELPAILATSVSFNGVLTIDGKVVS